MNLRREWNHTWTGHFGFSTHPSENISVAPNMSSDQSSCFVTKNTHSLSQVFGWNWVHHAFLTIFYHTSNIGSGWIRQQWYRKIDLGSSVLRRFLLASRSCNEASVAAIGLELLGCGEMDVGINYHDRTLFSGALEIMVYFREIIPFYGPEIQVSEWFSFTQNIPEWLFIDYPYINHILTI